MMYAEYCNVAQVWRLIFGAPGAYNESSLVDLDGQFGWQTRTELAFDLGRKGLTLTESNKVVVTGDTK
jgi:hypothetical protein